MEKNKTKGYVTDKESEKTVTTIKTFILNKYLLSINITHIVHNEH